jgi:hypothetical protein
MIAHRPGDETTSFPRPVSDVAGKVHRVPDCGKARFVDRQPFNRRVGPEAGRPG